MSQPTVYLVDDDASVRKALACLFASADLAVQGYSSAEDFLEAFIPTMSGCLVLDGRMPGMSGIDLLKTLRWRGCSLPVIYLTGYGDAQTLADVAAAGADEICAKPVAGSVLLEKVEAMLGR